MPKKATSSSDPSVLTVTAQQSRYALDSSALEAPPTKEIWIKDLSVSLGQRELLNRTEFRLKENGHYVLVGRNGTGKTTLLKAVAEGRVPGVPWGLRVLLLGQTRVEPGVEEKLGGLDLKDRDGETVIEHVVRSDKNRERLLREATILSRGVEEAADPGAAVRAYRQVQLARLERRLEEVKIMAERRSGAKGKRTREEQVKMEEEVAESKANLTQDTAGLDSATVAEETKAAAEMLAEVQASLEMMNADAAAARARTVLLGLGFPATKIDDSMSKLSGGWRTRCDLACALCQDCDILMLDEPTNFLDLPSIIWLQTYVQSIKETTVICVTHDRDFADAVADELLVLRNQKIEVFKGNLSTYERERIKKAKWLSKMKDDQEKQVKHFEKSIANMQAAAKRTGDDKKLNQAKSRQKRVDERMGMNVSAKGGKFKLNRDLGGYHLSNRGEIDVPDFDPPVKIKIPSEPPDLRFPGALVSLENVSFAYPAGRGKRGPEILKDITLTIHPGERVGLCGLNGSGKTTLVSCVMGADEGSSDAGALTPTKGTITRHARARFARFSQQVVEELEAFGAANKDVSALKHLMDIAGSELPEKDARGVLGSLGLQGPIASDVPLFALSGGQKVRLALAKVVWNAPHLLVLDEVTTHLDADTILGLVFALRQFQGAVLLVTHDRFFCRCVVEGQSPAKLRRLPNEELAGEEEEEESSSDDEDGPQKKGTVLRMFKGNLKVLEGGMDQYEGICERASLKLTKA